MKRDVFDTVSCFAPVIDARAKVLVLGSAPSVESLDKGFYYAHPQNAFWRIMNEIFQGNARSAAEKAELLKNNRVALWDVISDCERRSSLDSAIRKPVINDFGRLFNDYPGIRAVLLNGKRAFTLFPKESAAGRDILLLPSTSPANTVRYADKLKAYKDAFFTYL